MKTNWLNETDPLDTHFEETPLESVSEIQSAFCVIHTQFGSIQCPIPVGLPVPVAGELVRFYGHGVGFSVRGIVIGGRVYRYQTADQYEETHRRWVEDEQAKRLAEMEANADDHDRRIAALPEAFRARMEAFREHGGLRFRRDLEDYELFVCEQAAMFARELKTDEALVRFATLSWEEQKKALPGMDDDHSGNTFGAALLLARYQVTNPENVKRMHGAMAPLTGSAAYDGTEQ